MNVGTDQKTPLDDLGISVEMSRCHRHNPEQSEWSERKRKMQLGPKIKKPVKQANSDKFYNFLQSERNNKNLLQVTKIPALLFVSIIYLL